MSGMKKWRWLLMLAIFSLVATACSQDSGGSGEDSTTTAAETTATTAAPSTTAAEVTTTTAPPAAEEVAFDGVSVTEDTINIGMLADLTGIFAGLVVDITDAELAFWDEYNAAGGVDGRWQVNVLVEDTAYDVEQHGQKFEELKDQVVAFTQSTGSPHTASITPDLTESDLLAIPLSWYSGWSDPVFGKNTLEQGISYCLESMNVIEWNADQLEADLGRPPTVAIATFPGEYGQDGAAGAKIAIAELGLELVYDGEGAVIPGQDQSAVISGIVGSGADMVFTTVNPSTLAEIFGGTLAQGFQARWVGSGPSFSFRLLDTPIGEAIANSYVQSTYYAPFGADVPGMDALQSTLEAAFPDRAFSDAYTRGWIEFQLMKTVLERAAADGDLTRAGVVAAALSIAEFDFGGMAAKQTYAGDVNDYLARQSMFLKYDYQAFIDAGGVSATIADRPHFVSIAQDWWAGDVASNYDFTGPCFTG